MNNIDLIIDALELARNEIHDPTLWTNKVDKALAAASELKAELAQLVEPPNYVEPPTSDYHNGWEEGFEAAKNLFKKESALQNADPRLLLVRNDNCNAPQELAKPEQIIAPISPDQYERFCGTCGACTGKPWVGLTDKEIKGILDCSRGGLVDIKKAEQTLKDKNT
jgi:hypothetical protein